MVDYLYRNLFFTLVFASEPALLAHSSHLVQVRAEQLGLIAHTARHVSVNIVDPDVIITYPFNVVGDVQLLVCRAATFAVRIS